jgi:hypothetical protein
MSETIEIEIDKELFRTLAELYIGYWEPQINHPMGNMNPDYLKGAPDVEKAFAERREVIGRLATLNQWWDENYDIEAPILVQGELI